MILDADEVICSVRDFGQPVIGGEEAKVVKDIVTYFVDSPKERPTRVRNVRFFYSLGLHVGLLYEYVFMPYVSVGIL